MYRHSRSVCEKLAALLGLLPSRVGTAGHFITESMKGTRCAFRRKKAGSDRCGRERYAESGNRAGEVARDSNGSKNVREEAL